MSQKENEPAHKCFEVTFFEEENDAMPTRGYAWGTTPQKAWDNLKVLYPHAVQVSIGPAI